jgi:hypothetical protein
MGQEISSTEEILGNNEFLCQLTSSEVITDEKYWDMNERKRTLNQLGELINSTRVAKNRAHEEYTSHIPLIWFNPFLLNESMKKHCNNLCMSFIL